MTLKLHKTEEQLRSERALDILVAEKIFGLSARSGIHDVCPFTGVVTVELYTDDAPGPFRAYLKPYSTCIKAAWLVYDKLRESIPGACLSPSFVKRVEDAEGWTVWDAPACDDAQPLSYAATPALAICLAALNSRDYNPG